MAAGITIEDGGFRIVQCGIGENSWDIFARKVVKHKDGSTDVDWKNLAYGISFESCMNKIILCRTHARNPNVCTLQQFFENYKKERQLVVEAFQLKAINLTEDLKNLEKVINEKQQEKSNS